MIDAIGTEQFDGIAHALGATGLARMHRAVQPRRTGSPERFCEAWTRATGGRLVTIDRERHHSRMSQSYQRIDQLGRSVRRLRAQQTDAQTHRRQPVLFRCCQTGIDGVDQVG